MPTEVLPTDAGIEYRDEMESIFDIGLPGGRRAGSVSEALIYRHLNLDWACRALKQAGPDAHIAEAFTAYALLSDAETGRLPTIYENVEFWHYAERHKEGRNA